ISAANVVEGVGAKGGLAGESARHVTIPRRVNGDRQASIIIQAATRLLGPEDVPCVVVLGDKDVVAAAADQAGVAESGDVMKSARHVTVARRVHRDAPAVII